MNLVMRSCFVLLTAFLLLMTSASQADGVYKWKDARGVIQYGDEPPKSSHARQFKMPEITVIENYGEQWKPIQNNPAPIVGQPQRRQQPAIAPKQVIAVAAAPKKVYIPQYKVLGFIAPKSNQTIRAEDGDISAMLSIKPPLKKGHKVIFVLNGKNAGSSRSRITNFKNLSNGSHSVSANIVDRSGTIVMKGAVVPFQVKR